MSGNRDLVTELCDLHSRMVDEIRREKPYPARLRINILDSGIVIAAAVEIEKLRSAQQKQAA